MIENLIKLAILLNFFVVKVYSECEFAGSYEKQTGFAVNFQTKTSQCKEYFLGTFFKRQTILVVFTGNILNCNTGNITVYDENRNLMYDYCKNQKSTDLNYAITVGTHLIVDFDLKSSGGIYSFVNMFLYEPDGSLSSTTTSRSTVTTTTFTLPQFRIPNPGPTPETTTISPLFPGFKICGLPSIAPLDSEMRIIGGVEVIKNSWPWQVLLYEGQHACGGSLLNDQWILTAAHCVTPARWRAYLGFHDIRLATDLRSHKISKFIKHRDYDSNLIKNDIALLKLEHPVNFTNTIKPICLPNHYTGTVGRVAMVTGWGKITNTGILPYFLHQVAVPIRENSECSPFDLDGTQICAGYALSESGPYRDSCQSDSGGPLVTKEGNNFVLAGVVSYGNSICDGKGVYTNVSAYFDWIKETVSLN